MARANKTAKQFSKYITITNLNNIQTIIVLCFDTLSNTHK